MNELTNEFYLKQIIRYLVNDGHYLFRRPHINRESWAGLIGPKGDGKTFGAAIILLVDYMLDDKPVWSNFNITCTFEIDDETARQFDLSNGGVVTYQSLPLDREALLRFDPMYHDGALGLDEINVEFAEARRTSSNVNLFFDGIGQQARHANLSAIYTTISEMWVDTRIRQDLTDIFIKTEDLALSPEGLWLKKPPGVKFKWTIFGMSRSFTGESYYATGRPAVPPVYINAKIFHGLFDTKEKQTGKGKYTIDFKKRITGEFTVEKSPAVVKEYDDWGWLYNILTNIFQSGDIEEIDRADLQAIVSHQLGRGLTHYEIVKIGELMHQLGYRKPRHTHSYKKSDRGVVLVGDRR